MVALQLQGHRVAIIEKNALRGRNQEWNISRQELQVISDCFCVPVNWAEGALIMGNLRAACALALLSQFHYKCSLLQPLLPLWHKWSK